MLKNRKKMIAFMLMMAIGTETMALQTTEGIRVKDSSKDVTKEDLLESRRTTSSLIDLEREESQITTPSIINFQTREVAITPIIENPQNKVKNFSFEETISKPSGICWGGKVYPENWKGDNFSSSYANPIITLDEEEKISGKYSIKFEGIQKDGKGSRGWAAQEISVKPNTTYDLEVFLKAENITKNRFGIQVIEYTADGKIVDSSITNTLRIQVGESTHDWKKYTTEFKTGTKTTKILLKGFLGTDYSVNQGAKAWMDDIVLKEKEEVSVPEEGNLAPNGGFEKTVKESNTYWKDKEAPQYWNGIWAPSGDKGQKLFIDRKVFFEGKQSVCMHSPSRDSRTAFSNEITIDPTETYKLGIKMKTEEVEGGGVYFRTQYYDETGKKKQGDGPSINKVKGTNDWKNYEVILESIPAKTSKVRVEIFLENASGKAWMDDVKLEKTYYFALKEKEINLLQGKEVQLEAIFKPTQLATQINWISSDLEVATVDEKGMVKALKPGVVTITGQTLDGHKTSCQIIVEDPALKPYYKVLRERWSDRLTGNNAVNRLDKDYQKMMKNIEEEAQEVWNNMTKLESEKTDSRKELWSELNTYKESSHITKSFRNLKTMALAYSAKGCKLYQNPQLKKDILEGLDWMYANRYNERVATLYKNWWDWDIGAAQALCDTLVMMYEDLSLVQIENEVKALGRFNPTPFKVPSGPAMTGANLLDTALVSALKGMIAESNKGLEEAKQAISETLPYVTKGDGFYKDGSFIQHGDIPYAGGYGATFMSCIDKLMFILTETPWEVTDPLIENVYDWIMEAFRPLFYKGAIMDMVGGRGITRFTQTDYSRGKGILIPMLHLAETAREPEKSEIKTFIKENIKEGMLCTDYFKNATVNDMLTIKALLEDETINLEQGLELHKVYGAMDRVVHHTKDFGLGISMYSSRISNFEYGNGENKKGYHASDGMMYLYNADHEQYSKDYWPTVDMMRLAGTTTDRSPATVKDWKAYLSHKDWVGGSSLYDLYGSTGMNFEMEKTSLEGKKSWFSFDDEIVCLGSGITANDNRLVETMVENRKIKESGDNELVVNGRAKSKALGWKEVMPHTKWAYLGGNIVSGEDSIGYYFPQETTLTGLRESRTGSWKDINSDGPSDPITKNYLSLAIEHGKNPKNEGYSYVVLPNKNEAQIEAYSQMPDIEVLANDEKVQAVKEKKLGVTGINFWEEGQLDNIKVNKPCSLTLGENKDELTIGLSDPTQKAKEITLTLTGKEYEVVSLDSTIKVKTIDEGIEVTINVASSQGKTHGLKLKVKQDEETKVEVEKIKLNQVELLMKIGQIEKLQAEIIPEEATNKEVTWTSTNQEVVAVTAEGLVTAKGEGEATIQVRVEEGASATCHIVVIKQEEIPVEPEQPQGPTVEVERIQLSDENITLIEKNTKQLTATVFPEDATNKRVAWTSSHPEIVSVDEKGLVTAHKEGEAILIVTTEKGNVKVNCKVKVLKQEPNNPSKETNPKKKHTPNKSIEVEQVVAAKTVEEQWSKIDKKTKVKIQEKLNKELPYTILSESYDIKTLDELTQHQFTEKQLQVIQKDINLLSELGLSVNSEVIALTPVEEANFKDISPTYWANDAIQGLAKLGIVKGFEDGTFRPDEALHVEDTFSFLDRILLLNGLTESTLSKDKVEKYITDKNHFAYHEKLSIGSKLQEATLKKVAQLKDEPLSRGFVAEILYEITNAKLDRVKKVTTFKDIETNEYKEALAYCFETGLLYGVSDELMSPDKDLTRAELMAILERLNEALIL